MKRYHLAVAFSLIAFSSALSQIPSTMNYQGFLTGVAGIGVYGSHAANGWGVFGLAGGAAGVGIRLENMNTGTYGQLDNSKYGVFGLSGIGTMNASGVYGGHAGNAGSTYGVWGQITGSHPAAASAAVRGSNEGTGAVR